MLNEANNINLNFRHEDLSVFIPVVAGIISFVIYWFIWKSDRFQSQMKSKFGEIRGQANVIIFSRYIGGFNLGVLPTITYLLFFPETTFADLGLSLNSKTFLATAIWTIGLGSIMALITWNNARKPSTLEFYPLIRSKEWTKKLMFKNLFAWMVYLLGYEFWFRGVLLFPLVASIGLWPAIAVNIALYSATHIPKGLKETVGAIPLAIVLCLIGVQTGNFWVAAIVHITIAFTNTLTAFKHHPEMKFVK